MLNFLNLNNILALLCVLILSSCSTSQPKNKWQYNAVNMTQTYQSHFLQAKESHARIDLRQARRHAKQSADLKVLIDIELTQCAMQVCVLKFQNCKNARSLLIIQPNASQEAYLSFLNSTLQEKDINLLPQQYQGFAYALEKKNAEGINKILKNIRPLSSKVISSSLSRDFITQENISLLIKELSFSGYKHPLISWLKLQASREKDTTKKLRIQAKIEVLTSE
ncbi:MAG: hypothetical protein COA44_10210 [Arcobacter sp.]|nr:MAG: hypothetical protein COA44_10210 [Arcobacter sp.]